MTGTLISRASRIVWTTVSIGISSCIRIASSFSSAGRSAWMSAGIRRRFAPGATTMLFCPLRSITISATPVGASATAATPAISTPSAAEAREEHFAEGIAADPADEPRPPAEPRHGHRLVRALAAGDHAEVVAEDVLARRRRVVRPDDQVRVRAADDADAGWLHALHLDIGN